MPRHNPLNDAIKAATDRALPFNTDQDVDKLIERISGARVVFLGAATHGTENFYAWRRHITQRLIMEHGFEFVAAECDWVEARRLDRYVLTGDGGNAFNVLEKNERWPTWLLANTEVIRFGEWLRQHNATLPDEQKARFYGLDIAEEADAYMRALLHEDVESWNSRDRHMLKALDHLLDSKNSGRHYRGVVWAHNAHVGDYHYATSLAVDNERRSQLVNLGGMAREKYGAHNVALIGQGAGSGTLLASRMWYGVYEVMGLPPPQSGSLEDILRQACARRGLERLLLLTGEKERKSVLSSQLEYRNIGVVLDPEIAQPDLHSPVSLLNAYDAFIYIDQTAALSPIHTEVARDRVAETWPFGR